MRPICYLNPGKSNARRLLEAFADGSGAEITERLELVPERPAVFYGVDRATEMLYRQVRRSRHPHYYIDNGYFRSKFTGGDYYRITRNRPQVDGFGESDGSRWKALGLEIKPWRKIGKHILLACQSPWWHERHDEPLEVWVRGIKMQLARYTERPVLVRQKPSGGAAPKLEAQLEDCWAVVTHSGMTGAEALLAGVPVFVTDHDNALLMMGRCLLSEIEAPFYPGDRERWAGVLADNQWTVDEIQKGVAWRMLSA